MQNNAGIYEQIQSCCKKKYHTTLTTEILDDFLNELNKQNMFKRRNKSEVTLKSETSNCDRCICEKPSMNNEYYKPIYTVVCVLNEKYWNEELKRYLAVGIDEQNSLLISETAEVTFTVTGNLWNVIESIQSNKINKVTITQVILGTPEEVIKGTVN